jgi:gamma-glutamyltranspeptidase/glutathione hydrolase
MAPVLVLKDGTAVASVGSSGGRRILNCNAQVIMNMVDHGLTPQPAIGAPRIDASTPDLIVSTRLPAATRDALAALGHKIAVRDEIYLHGEFASAVAIKRDELGEFLGGVDPYYPAMAIGVQQETKG